MALCQTFPKAHTLHSAKNKAIKRFPHSLYLKGIVPITILLIPFE